MKKIEKERRKDKIKMKGYIYTCTLKIIIHMYM